MLRVKCDCNAGRISLHLNSADGADLKLRIHARSACNRELTRRLLWPGISFLILAAIGLTSGDKPANLANGLEDVPSDALYVGMAAKDITPDPKTQTVWLAGFGRGRKATGIHDPVYARAVVLRYRQQKIALVSLDLIGFFYPEVKAIRQSLPDYDYVLVSSTHNHEGPDTLGLWGPNLVTTGVDETYIALVRRCVVEAVRQAEKVAQPVTAYIGMIRAPELLHDSRLPIVKHDELVALDFRAANKDSAHAGLLVQWNCHPETLGSKNTLISADFVGATVKALEQKYKCPVTYFTGTVGGLLSSLGVEVRDADGRLLEDGTWAKTERYGILVAEKAQAALKQAKAVRLVPWQIRTQVLYLPVTNRYYQAAAQIGVVKRETFLWTGDPYKRLPAPAETQPNRLAIETEIGLLTLGELQIAAVPGEIYSELVVGGVQDPPDPGADFPDAPIEPVLYRQLSAPYKMIVGLANDELGYIIPKRQWDEKPPFCYNRKEPQYGEINSLGPDTAPLLLDAFRKLSLVSKTKATN